jgi:large subunit ribosomal protein L15
MHDGVKLLGDGDIKHVLTIHVHKASASAISKVEAAGGRVELIPFQK